jgi:phosphinothricin acetyltransferase
MIRTAIPADATALAAIYNHYIRETVITFEEADITPADMAQRIGKLAAAGLPWLVLEEEGELLGYAYAGPWRERSAYRFASESSVYLRHDATGRGRGKRLYAAVIAAARAAGRQTLIGGVALPNAASVALHEGLGFEKVAHFARVGRKFERWIDVGYWQLAL